MQLDVVYEVFSLVVLWVLVLVGGVCEVFCVVFVVAVVVVRGLGVRWGWGVGVGC